MVKTMAQQKEMLILQVYLKEDKTFRIQHPKQWSTKQLKDVLKIVRGNL